MRKHLTTLLWHEDRLSSLSLKYLMSVTLLCTALLACLAGATYQFLDDLVYLLADNDLTLSLIVLPSVFVVGAALWVLSCCLAALGRRLLLQLRGL